MSPNPVPRFPIADDLTPQQNTPGSSPVDTGDLTAAAFDPAARRRLAAWLDTALTHGTLVRRENWPLALAVLAVTGSVLLTVWLLAAFVTTLIKAAGITGATAADWLHRDGIVHTVTGSIRGWLDSNTAGLPATGADLGLAWAGITAVLYLAAIGGSTYARIAWALTGLAATAAAYAGAATTTAAAAAGTTATVWLLLSLPVYRRRHRSIPTADTTAR